MPDEGTSPHQIAHLLSTVLGERLVAVYHFGSTVAQGELGTQLRLLVIVDAVDRGLLDTLAPTAARLQSERVKLRLGTTASLLRGADAFPAFSLELLHSRVLLKGQDVLASLHVDPSLLRLRIEQGLRALHRDLIDAYLSRRSNQEMVHPLRRTTRKLAYLLEGTIMAGGLDTPNPATPHAVIETVRSTLSPTASAGSWDTFQAFALRGGTLDEAATLPIFDALLNVLQSVIEFVDAMESKPAV